jgi:hypothetical protein
MKVSMERLVLKASRIMIAIFPPVFDRPQYPPFAALKAIGLKS